MPFKRAPTGLSRSTGGKGHRERVSAGAARCYCHITCRNRQALRGMVRIAGVQPARKTYSRNLCGPYTWRALWTPAPSLAPLQHSHCTKVKRRGHCKGCAFFESESEEVAKTVAEIMKNYLLGKSILKCQFYITWKKYPNKFLRTRIFYFQDIIHYQWNSIRAECLKQKLIMEKELKNKEN